MRRKALGFAVATLFVTIAACRSSSSSDSAAAKGSAPQAGPAASVAPSDLLAGAAHRTSTELERMLTDRPKMRDVITSHPPLYDWLTGRFLGQSRTAKVRWDPTLPASGQPAEHLAPTRPGEPATLRLDGAYSAQDQVAGAVYEMLNMEADDAMAQAWADARARKVDKAAFASRMTRLEHGALVRFQQVAAKHALRAKEGDALLPRLLDAPTGFEDFLVWSDKLRTKDAPHSAIEYWMDSYDQAFGL